jgi:hypothetical protein
MVEISKAQSARKSSGKAEGKTQGNLNGQRGKAFERKLAKATGGKRVPTSGAGSIKGDVLTRFTLIEAKTSARIDASGEKVIQLKREWLLKMLKEAQSEGKLIAVLAIHFLGETQDWAVMPWDTLNKMLAQLEGLYALGDWLERNASVAALLPTIEMPALGRPLFTVPEGKEGDV